jgi:hypothetical protein
MHHPLWELPQLPARPSPLAQGAHQRSRGAAPAAPTATAVPTGMRAAPEPSSEKGTTSNEPGPSRAPSPPLPEITGRPARIAADRHADDPLAGVLAAMTGAL